MKFTKLMQRAYNHKSFQLTITFMIQSSIFSLVLLLSKNYYQTCWNTSSTPLFLVVHCNYYITVCDQVISEVGYSFFLMSLMLNTCLFMVRILPRYHHYNTHNKATTSKRTITPKKIHTSSIHHFLLISSHFFIHKYYSPKYIHTYIYIYNHHKKFL